MPTEAVLSCLSSTRFSESFQMNMILQTAPVLKKVKASCMFTVPTSYTKMVKSLFARTSLRVRVLCRGANRDVLLVYREEALEAYVNRKENRAFLRQFGYGEGTLDAFLTLLGEHVSRYYNREHAYPHEMGIFLGYPLEDVRGFFLHEGKDSLLTGYWKVYSDVEQAKRTFRLYDEAKETSVREFFTGKRVWEIALA